MRKNLLPFRALRNRYNLFLIRNNLFAPVEQRIFILITYLALLMTLAGNIVNVALNLPLSLIGITLFASLVILYFFYKAKTEGNKAKYVYPFIILSMSLLSIAWIINGGIDSNMTSLFYVYYIVVFTLTPFRRRMLVSILFGLNLIGLILLNFFFPHLVTPYQTATQRFVDLLTGNMIYLMVMYTLLSILMSNINFDQKRVKIRNDALNELNTRLQARNREIEEYNFRLKESEERYSSIVNHSPNVILVHDGVKTIYVNSLAYVISGYTAEEIYSRPIFDFLSEGSAKLASENIRRRLAGECIDDYEISFRIKSGELKYFIVSGTLIRFDRKPAILLNLSDITERKKAEEALERYSLELKESNATKDRFISILSHDLRSPFYGLVGLSEVLSKEIHKLNKEEIANYAGKLHDSIALQYDLLNDLLTWSQIHTGKITVIAESFSGFQTMADIIVLFREQARLKNIQILNQVPDKVMINGDRRLINMVFRNLIHNALKFSFPNGTVKISYLQQSDGDNFYISDNGLGMASEDIEQLFHIDKIYSTRGTNNEKGSGMGLQLCKEIMDVHGGTISVISTPNKETTFNLFFPRK